MTQARGSHRLAGSPLSALRDLEYRPRDVMSSKALFLASLLLSAALGPSGAVACQLVKVAEAPLVELGTHYAISVTLGDEIRPMIVDTGAETSMLTSSIVDELQLKPDPTAEVRAVLGIGQSQAAIHENAIAPLLAIGGLVYHDRSMVVGEMSFGNLPESAAIGLIGDDILSKFDVEFDFPSDKLTFYHSFQCYGSFSPWTGDYVMIPFDHHEAKVVVDAILDQERTRAIVDTGNNASFISRRATALWGVPESAFRLTPGLATSPLNGGTSTPIKTYTFDSVEIGGKTFHQMRMNIVDVDLLTGSANLGLDYWRTRKVWISYSRHWMFIADRAAAASLAFPVEAPPEDAKAAAEAAPPQHTAGLPDSALPQPPR
jgi:hypothetical protein